MLEVIRPVVGEEGRYEVSNYGRVWSLLHHNGRPRLLKGTVGKSGYHTIDLRGRGQHTGLIRTVHSIVAQAFLPNPCNLPEVRHKDRVKTHNEESNLEWCTHQVSTDYAFAKTYDFINPAGEHVVIRNLKRFCMENELSCAGMHMLRKGDRPAYKGWRRYVNQE